MYKAYLCLCFSIVALASDGLKVSQGPFRQEVLLGGQLSASTAEKIFVPRTNSWRVQIKWMIEEGKTVEPGEVVVRFDNSGMVERVDGLYKEIVQKNEALSSKLAEAETSKRDQSLNLETKQIDFEKAELEASVPQNLLSEYDYQQKQLALTKARSELELAKEDVVIKETNFEAEMEILKLSIGLKTSDYERQKMFLQSLEVATRSEGVVIYGSQPWEDRKIQIGDMVQVGMEVMQIPDLGSMEVEAYVSETDLALVSVGLSATMHLDAYPDQVSKGKVISVSNKGETKEQWGEAAWFRVLVSLDEVDRARMRPGMSVQVNICVIDEKDALLLPISAAFIKDGAYHVKPLNNEPIPLKVLGVNAFNLAVATGGELRVGMELEP